MYNDYNDNNDNIRDDDNIVEGEYSFVNNNAGNGSSFDYSDPEPDHDQPEPKRKKPRNKKNATIAAVLAAALVCGFGGSAIGYAVFGGGSSGSGSTTVREGERPSTVITTASVDTSKQMTAAEVYAANVNSTVGITTQVTTNFFGYTTQSAAAGSGFIYSSDGYIVTNYHVIESASSIKVTLYNGDSYNATLVGYDESNDVAVLKIDATGLTPVTLGDSDNLNVGDPVVAIGNPLGELTFSLTSGSVSALNREVTMSNNTSMELIQTDAAINAGNSGGALFDLYGEVIGITNAKYSSNSSSEASIDNIGFAIPINTVKSIINSIIEKGYVEKPYIGVSVTDVSDEAKNYGLPEGAAVAAVTDGGPADKAGVKENDIITKVDGETISGKNDLSKIIGNHKAGDKLTLTIYRQGETLDVTVEVGVQTTAAADNQSNSSAQQQYEQQQQRQRQQIEDFFGFGG